ncbi:MAG: A24 family peptidase [Desulfobacca sp.]|nr:A24 family peptidase [Desulfobacca sp.]
MVELAGGLMTLALWRTFPDKLLLIAYGPFCLALLALTVIDLEHRLLPDVITIPGIILGIFLSLVSPHLSPGEALAGALGGRGLILRHRMALSETDGPAWSGWRRRKADGHDRGLSGSGGAAAGHLDRLSLGVLTGLIYVLAKGSEAQGQWRTVSLPYGPFLALGSWAYLLSG